MLTRIIIYCFLYPLSLLPLWILYGIARLMKVVLYYIVRYRRKVVRTNLRNSFPEKSEKELLLIEKQYFQHLCNIFIEGVKLLTISKKQLLKRYHCINKDIVNQYFDKKQSVILLSGHYNNWEWMVLSLDMQFHHHGIGVGKANSNKVFELLINKARTRYGTEVVFADTVRQVFENNKANNIPSAYMMLCDQSPANVQKSFITTFLHQPSAMIYGGEYFAKKYHYPVFYYSVNQYKRGYYEIELQLICEDASTEPYGKIINEYVAHLEKNINEYPQYWLWSHRRWKHKIV